MTRTRTVERTTALSATPGRVFEALTAPDTVPLVDPSVRSWTPDREPVGIGTRFTIRGRLGPLPFRVTSEVTAWEPPHHAAFRSLTARRLLIITADHRCAAELHGGTRYTWSITCTGPRPAVGVVARFFARAQALQSAALRAFLEAQGSLGTNT